MIFCSGVAPAVLRALGVECPVSELAPHPGGGLQTWPAGGEGYGLARSTYVRRRPEDTVLHQVMREHLETFLAEARRRGGGAGLPRFVERELREFLRNRERRRRS